jgi:hypothetical protein
MSHRVRDLSGEVVELRERLQEARALVR